MQGGLKGALTCVVWEEIARANTDAAHVVWIEPKGVGRALRSLDMGRPGFYRSMIGFKFFYLYFCRMSGTDIHFLLTIRNQLKVYHWQTKIYARHMATDRVLEELDKLIDSYVEVFIGKYGRPKLDASSRVLRLQTLTEAGATKMVNAAIRHMQGPMVKGLDPAVDSDLINLRDEMVADLNQLLYLFTLH